MFDKVEFSVLSDGRILDLRPMYTNKPPLVFKEGSWINFQGASKEILESKPIASEKVKDLTASTYLS